MPVDRLKEFLEENDIQYETLAHSEAFTAQEAAAAAHIPGKDLAKVVMVKIDGEMAMVALPATYKVSLERLENVTGADRVALADEDEFRGLFPTCEPGAMPPFGNLWDMQVFVDRHLREDERIAFAAGTHHELVRLAYSDFEELVNPVVAELATE